MDLFQFTVALALLFSTAYSVPTVVAIKSGAFSGEPQSDVRLKSGFYWFIQIVICLSVLAIAFYLAEVGTFNGIVNIRREVGISTSQYLIMELVRYVPPALGGFLGAFLTYRAIKSRQAQTPPNTLLLSMGLFCIIYGLIHPTLMQHFWAAALDSHLIS